MKHLRGEVKGPPGGENAMNGYKKDERALPAANHVHVHMPTIIMTKDAPKVLAGVIFGVLLGVAVMSVIR